MGGLRWMSVEISALQSSEAGVAVSTAGETVGIVYDG